MGWPLTKINFPMKLLIYNDCTKIAFPIINRDAICFVKVFETFNLDSRLIIQKYL
jgi:hypothetical protein